MTTFDDDVDAWTLAAVQAAPEAFDDLVCRLPGVYPTDVRSSLDRLFADGQIRETDWRRATQREPRLTTPSRSLLPVPHPLDFDWRFTDGALDAIIAACDRRNGSGVHIACIGAPSLHARLMTMGRHSTLLDANAEMIAALGGLDPSRAIQARIGCDPLPAITTPVVVIDPPWYPEHVRLFLWAASQLCANGGSVILSFPPVGTRPGVSSERDDALAYAAEIGLIHHDIQSGALAYQSPPFERLALAAVGYSNMPEDWRRGDLICFSAVSSPNPPPVPDAVIEDATWASIPAGRTRIKVRRAGCTRVRSDLVSSRLTSIIEGDVLPTVSRRDERRSQVSVWTACNRVYACADTEVLTVVSEAIDHAVDTVQSVATRLGRHLAGREVAEVRATEKQLVGLLDTESRDLEACNWYTRAA